MSAERSSAVITPPSYAFEPYIPPAPPPPEGPTPAAEQESNGELLNVASHELNHALVAYVLGVPVVQWSIIQEGDVLGKTVLGENVDLETLKIIAAAGSIGTPHGKAEGFGSDLARIGLLASLYGGIGPDEARSRAFSILSKYSLEVRAKAAQIMASKKSISFPDMGDIMRRAYLKVKYEETGIRDPYLDTKLSLRLPNHEDQRYDQQTEIVNLGENGLQVSWLEGGKVRKEMRICHLCLGFDGHFPTCAVFQGQQDLHTSSNESSDTSQFYFPKSGTIYEWTPVEIILKKGT